MHTITTKGILSPSDDFWIPCIFKYESRKCCTTFATFEDLDEPEARCPACQMLVNAREWRNNASWSGVAYTTSGSKARSNARWLGRSLTFKTRWRMCFSGFRTSRLPSFVFMKTFSFFFFFLIDRTRIAVKVIYLLISVQFTFFPCTLNGDIP